jgi:YbbR domain-containing protein
LLKGAALAVAGVAWFSLALQQRETVVHTLELPVTYRNVPAEWLVEQPEPKRVSVTLSAPKPALDRLDTQALALSIDLLGLEDGAHSVKLGAHNLELDPEISLQRVEPGHVRVVAHKTELRELPIQAQLDGSPAQGHVLKSRSISPATLKVLVASDSVARLTHLSTEAIDLGALREPTERSVGVVLPEGARLAPDQPGKVAVRLEVVPRGAPDS